MINPITTKFEIDVMQAVDVPKAVELAMGHSMPALIVHPDLSANVMFRRGRIGAGFKVITPVDWPKGQLRGMNKMTGLQQVNLQTDGFEILLTESESINEVKDELSVLTEFAKMHLPPHVELRFVLGTTLRNAEKIGQYCSVIKGIPAPAMLRNDHHTKIQQSKANADLHNETIKLIRESANTPIKISGNINTLKIVASCSNATRFGLNLKQASDIIAELRNDPNKARETLQPAAG